MAEGVAVCSRCGSEPSPFPVPPKRCPACRAQFDLAAVEGRVHCPECHHEFEDYEEWVRRCRVAAHAAIRPVPPPPEEPPPRPPHLALVASGLLVAAAFYAAAGMISGHAAAWAVCTALALVQGVAGISLLAGRRHSDVLVRIAAGASALVPLFTVPVVLSVGVYALFSRPQVSKYFGGRPDPMSDRFRHPLVAWLIVLVAIVAGLYLTVVADALDAAARWNEPRTFLLEAAAGLLSFFARNLSWAPAGVVGALCVLALWGRINRHGFLAVAVLALVGVVALGAPPVAEAWLFERSAREADSFRQERNVQRLLWGAREGEPDPKIRVASLRGLSAVGRDARVVVPAMARAVRDPDRRVRIAAASALAQFDPAFEGIFPILISALEDDRSSEEERDQAAQAVGYLGPRSRPALPLLLDRLRKSDAATLALVELGPASIPGLAEALADRDPKVRRRAARALRLHGPGARSAVPLLTLRLKDDDAGVRAEAASALGEIHREKAVPLLRGLLHDDPGVVRAAAEALCALGERDGMAYLPQGSSAMNALRQPALWDHLGRAMLEKDVEGSGAEILVDLAERAVMCAEIPSEVADHPSLTAFRRIFLSARRRSVLEVLSSLDLDFVVESDRIRILTADQARTFWTEWLSEIRKKRE